MTIFTQQPLAIRGTIIAIFAAILLMLLDSKNPEWFAPLRDFSHAAMQPIYRLSAYPSVMTQAVSEQAVSKETLYRENLALKTELMHAHAQLQQLDYLIAQNARLQGILSATRPEQFNVLLAQVVGIDTNPLRQIIVINKGSNDGVTIGQTIVDEKGVMGQVINVYQTTSRVLLLSDEQQSVAVTIKRTGQKAIVSGTGNPQQLSLDYVFKASDVRIGDELISSGLGGRIPAGFPVGRVASVESEQAGSYAKIAVTPAANFVNTAYVLLLQQKG